MDQLQRYHDELVYWNERVNMVSRQDISQLWERHIFHSLMLVKHVDFSHKARVLDVGTGGGFPGLPLKIARPDLLITLCDSIRKKTKVVEMFAQHTGLRDISVVCDRAENLANLPNYAASFDVIVSRAVARTASLLEWTMPLVKAGGTWALLKGGDLDEELHEARIQFPKLEIIEQPLHVFGLPSYTTDQKKLVTCKFS